MQKLTPEKQKDFDDLMSPNENFRSELSSQEASVHDYVPYTLLGIRQLGWHSIYANSKKAEIVGVWHPIAGGMPTRVERLHRLQPQEDQQDADDISCLSHFMLPGEDKLASEERLGLAKCQVQYEDILCFI